jgi:hypothetical protein
MKKHLNLLVILMVLSLSAGNLALADSRSGSGINGSGKATLNFGLNDKVRGELELEDENELRGREAEGEPVRADHGGLLKSGANKEKTEINLGINIRRVISERLIHRANNLAQISNRIKSRINKLEKETEINGSAALALVAKADTSIALAKTNSAKVQADVETEASIEIIKKDVAATKASLKEAHGYLVQAVKNIRSQMGDINSKSEIKAEAKAQ